MATPAMTPVGSWAESALACKIKTVQPKIKKIMHNCSDCRNMQPAVDEIVDISLKHGLAYKKNILPNRSGIHHENRARTGVDPLNAQNLAWKISNQGYSETKLENPMGFEKAEAGTAATAFHGLGSTRAPSSTRPSDTPASPLMWYKWIGASAGEMRKVKSP